MLLLLYALALQSMESLWVSRALQYTWHVVFGEPWQYVQPATSALFRSSSPQAPTVLTMASESTRRARTRGWGDRNAATTPGNVPMTPTTAGEPCDIDASLVTDPPRGLSAWLPRLDDAEFAANFTQLRYLLSGRHPRDEHGWSRDMSRLLAQYKRLHADIMSGVRPLRLFVYHKAGGGIGDRFKGWRIVFWLAVLSGRAIVVSPGDATVLDHAFVPNEVDWRLPASVSVCCCACGVAASD